MQAAHSKRHKPPVPNLTSQRPPSPTDPVPRGLLTLWAGLHIYIYTCAQAYTEQVLADGRVQRVAEKTKAYTEKTMTQTMAYTETVLSDQRVQVLSACPHVRVCPCICPYMCLYMCLYTSLPTLAYTIAY